MVEPVHHRLSIAAQRRLLRISRSSYYYASVPEIDERLAPMAVIYEASWTARGAAPATRSAVVVRGG